MKFKQCEPKFHPRHGFSVARSFWQRCDRSRTLLKFYSEPPSPRLNSIAQILPSAKAEDEPPPLCLNSAAPTDRRPAPGSVTSSVAGPIGSKPAAKPKQLARANDLAKPTRTAADKPVVKPRDRRSRRTAEAPDRSSIWFQNRLVRQMSRPINNPSRKSPTDCNPSGLIRK
ncbi:hypothetical protein CGRAC_1399 [Campylobacter gracilis]|nr:hypothetical protein CGRAC_1399 [Campylobacter gracilis]